MNCLLTGLLFGIPPFDPMTFGGASALLVAIGLRRATGPRAAQPGSDAIEALKYE
jgi:hypothetical protein